MPSRFFGEVHIMNKPLVVAAATIAVLAMAQEADAQQRARPVPSYAAPVSYVPNQAFFVGLGGSFNIVDFGTQDVYAVGTSDVFNQAGVRLSSGSAWGPASLYMNNESSLAFSVQGGFFRKFEGSDWLWGAKFSYSYLNATSSLRNALLPQAGAFTPVNTGVPVSFTGNAVVRTYRANIIHQMALVPFIGRSFDRGYVYAGAGPTLSQVRTDLYDVIGFADTTGQPSDVSGRPISFSAQSWVYGATGVIGVTYFLAPTWFLDVSYTAAVTQNHTDNYFSPFTNNNGTNNTTIVGTLVGSTGSNVVTQGVTVTINKTF